MDNEIKIMFENLNSIPLSDLDLTNITYSNIKKYNDLINLNSIDECLDNEGRCIIFYENNNSNLGHWTAIRKNNNTIEFFDSYSNHSNNIITFLNYESNTDSNLLYNLIINSGYGYNWNKIKYQKRKDNVNTCGKHVLLFLLINRPLKEYNKIMKQIKNKYKIDFDHLVSGISYILLNK